MIVADDDGVTAIAHGATEDFSRVNVAFVEASQVDEVDVFDPLATVQANYPEMLLVLPYVILGGQDSPQDVGRMLWKEDLLRVVFCDGHGLASFKGECKGRFRR